MESCSAFRGSSDLAMKWSEEEVGVGRRPVDIGQCHQSSSAVLAIQPCPGASLTMHKLLSSHGGCLESVRGSKGVVALGPLPECLIENGEKGIFIR